jgi:predicted RNA-binding Zn-ribbon protein involved in translation (DUF1610 family)
MIAKILKNATPDDYATFDCPGCGLHGVIDKEQYDGVVSIDCPACSFHETVRCGE